MVRLAGIEPTTPWFVAKYSIQLSYSRRSHDYMHIFEQFLKKASKRSIFFKMLPHIPRITVSTYSFYIKYRDKP